MKLTTLLLIAVFYVATGTAQVRTFTWSDELCDFSATYDSKKSTQKQLENTRRLLSSTDLRLDTFNATVWNYPEIAKLDIAALDTKYKALTDELEKLDYVRTPFTDSVRKDRLEETRQLYQLARTTMAAYTDPTVIRNYSGAEACKLNYGEPIIAGGEELIKAWRKVNLDSQSRNASPERLQKRWDEQNASPDRLKFALVETMSFGWWNCANAEIKYSQHDQSDRADKEFRKLFIRVRTVRCDEP
ncbi:MAG TPA: hypothetical protein VFZ49_07195 [Pyrinomonadaceae bacterium]